MQRYTVIWRGNGDDFIFTALDLEPEFYATLNNNQLIQMCHDAEWPDEDEPNPYVGANPASYEMIEVITGTDVQFVGRF